MKISMKIVLHRLGTMLNLKGYEDEPNTLDSIFTVIYGIPTRTTQSRTHVPCFKRESADITDRNRQGLASAYALYPLYGLPLYFRGQRME